MRPRYRWAAALAAVAALVPAASASAAAPALTLGFSDLQTLQSGNPAEQPLELEHLKSTRARQLRIMWGWDQIEQARPTTDAEARDPGFAGYGWTRLDHLLRNVAAAGVEPLLELSHSPSWWERDTANRPPVSADYRSGTWKPDPVAFGRFMTAVATRYSGTYPDPLNPGATLPRVRYWQIWNEPNLSVELNPQWEKDSAGKWHTLTPRLYRELLNQGFDAVKSVHADNTVITAGTAPYGEPWVNGKRLQPARFWRELLCVTGRVKLTARDCSADPVKFDVMAHHPYPIGPPGRKAINADDVVVPDFHKIIEPLKVALKAGNIFPKTKSKPIWATEMSWDSSPPDPGGIPAGQQAQYAAGAMYVLWRQGVKRLYWWNLRDEAKGPGYEYTLQSGVFYRGPTVAQDTPKPSFTAFRFPFVAYRAYSNFRGSGRARLWGIAPNPGRVKIQRQEVSGWKTVTWALAGNNHIIDTRLTVSRGMRLRAVQNGEASIDAKVF